LPRGTALAQRALGLYSWAKFGGVTVEGALPSSDEHGLVIIGNHPSNPEIFPLMWAILKQIDGNPRRLPHAMAKEELFTGVRGKFLDHFEQIRVNRAVGKDAIVAAAEVLRDSGIIVVYPEGTLTKNDQGWPTPVTQEEQFRAKLKGLREGSEKYNDMIRSLESYHFNGTYKKGIEAPISQTEACVVPALTLRRQSDVLIRFGESIQLPPNGSLERKLARRQLVGGAMLDVATMMAEERGVALPTEVHERILAG
jgi:hypothetical protein